MKIVEQILCKHDYKIYNVTSVGFDQVEDDIYESICIHCRRKKNFSLNKIIDKHYELVLTYHQKESCGEIAAREGFDILFPLSSANSNNANSGATRVIGNSEVADELIEHYKKKGLDMTKFIRREK